MTSPPLSNQNYHALEVQVALEQLQSEVQGLAAEEAKQRTAQFGANELPQSGKGGPWQIFIRQVKSLMTYVLLAAALLSAAFRHWLDAGVILVILVINFLIGFIQEYRAERALDALRNLLVLQAKVYRDGRLEIIPARELVPGDVIVLSDGDKIPADARIITSSNLQTSEASLTGESFPVDKSVPPLPENTGLAERTNMVWMGTLVVRGTAEAVVTGIGLQTAVGQIAQELARIPAQPGHFEQRMRRLTQQMAALAIGVASLTFLIGAGLRGIPIVDMLSFAIAALVSGIPEGLPVIVAIVLAVGSRRMAKRNAIVRQLSAIETLGAVTVIVTDKTGTLTQNKMAVQAVIPGKGDPIILDTVGEARQHWHQLTRESNSFRKLLHVAAVCHSLRQISRDGKAALVGDPTEVALVEFASSLGLGLESESVRHTKIDDLGFVQEKRWRACLVKEKQTGSNREIFVIGAPEAVLDSCRSILENDSPRPLSESERESILSGVKKLTDQAMRVIALAYRPSAADQERVDIQAVGELVYLGAVGILDPPRPEVAEAIRKARGAGIRVIMATGDHPQTALAIGEQIGLLVDGNPSQQIVNGNDLANADDAAFDRIAKEAVICARFTPSIKLKLAAALQRQGEIVAMTGDGVNDAPALKQADVGISMAITGTEVARESSEIVLADDNFASIVSAIEEGRTQFRNARRAILFLVTTNIAESVTILATLFFGWPLPLLPTQILWLNLVTDGVTDVSLAMEPTHEDVLHVPPRRPKEQILTASMLPFLLISTTIMVILTAAVFWLFWQTSLEKARTGAFAVMAWAQLMNVMNMRSLKASIFRIGFFTNRAVVWALVASVSLLLVVLYLPWLDHIFMFVPLSALEMVAIVAASSLVFWGVELYKFLRRHKIVEP